MASNDVISATPDEEKVTKATFRFKVWNLMENKDFVNFPRPCKGRIPNFVGSRSAAERLASLDSFKKADVIKVNIDKSQEPVRFMTLEEGKTLLVPLPRLAEGIILKVCLPENANRQQISLACRRKGIDEFGERIAKDKKIHIDMIVLGSVAVSKEGYRIGKGEGFSDLEYGLMAATGLVSEETVIVTTVHDEQVFDHLPHDLFQPFDVPVDIIVTPTKVIEVTSRLHRPKGILWNFVSDRRLQLIPVLKNLRTQEMDEGKACPLKEVDSEPEDRPKPYYRPNFIRRRPFMRSRRPVSRESHRTQSPPAHDAPRRTRTFRRGGNQRRRVDGSGDASVQVNGQSDHSDHREPREPREKREPREYTEQRGPRERRKTQHVNGENKENQLPQSRPRPIRRGNRRPYKPRLPVDFTVKVGNIASTMRVRDLKAALIEKGVRPRDITWKGPRGFALLHFAKLKSEEEPPMAVDSVIASLQGLTVKCKIKEEEDSERLLSVEPGNPISRIEDAGVTAV